MRVLCLGLDCHSGQSHLRWMRAWMLAWCLLCCFAAQSQPFRFTLRAEPDLIPANGTSSTSIFVQVHNNGQGAIAPQAVVRFSTTLGIIEPTARLVNGTARVLLRSSATPGTAIITAFVGNSREQIAVDFSNDRQGLSRFWQINGAAVSYGVTKSLIIASGPCSFDLGDTHIESDTRLDIDLASQLVWAEGNAGHVIIRQGEGAKSVQLRGDRLFYDLRRKRGVIRRTDLSLGPARQEFMGRNLAPPPGSAGSEGAPTIAQVIDEKRIENTLAGTAKKNTTVEKTQPTSSEQTAVEAPPAAGASSPATFSLRPAALDLNQSPLLQKVNGEVGKGEATDEPGRIAEVPKKQALLNGSDKTEPGKNEPENSGPDEELQSVPTAPPAYKKLPVLRADKQRFAEPSPPEYDNQRGYWVVSRWMRVFPNDKLQFGKATVFYGGRKLFYMRLYVAPLDGSFNPATNIIGVNSDAGLSLRVPYYYQASPKGTGAVYLVHAPKNGFSTEKPGLSLAMQHEYWMSNRSQGRFEVDDLGRGAWNARWDHRFRLSSTVSGSLYAAMPRHKDTYLNGALAKEFRKFDIGLQTFYARPRGGQSNLQGSFYARLRPKEIGNSGWSSTVTATLVGMQRFYPQLADGTTSLQSRALLGQTVSANFIGPTYRLWKGASLDATLSATAYNYNTGKRGVSPGLNLGFQQFLGKKAMVRLDYTYDKGNTTPYSNGFYANGTNFLNASAQVNVGSKIYTSFLWSHSLNDGSQFGFSTLDYYFTEKWRAGLFADYTRFDDVGFLNYGLSLGRLVGAREFSLNWDKERNRFYVEFGNFFN